MPMKNRLYHQLRYRSQHCHSFPTFVHLPREFGTRKQAARLFEASTTCLCIHRYYLTLVKSHLYLLHFRSKVRRALVSLLLLKLTTTPAYLHADYLTVHCLHGVPVNRERQIRPRLSKCLLEERILHISDVVCAHLLTSSLNLISGQSHLGDLGILLLVLIH